MEPAQALTKKRKTDDDFVLTISDNEDDSIPDLDAELLATTSEDVASNKKRKRGNNEPRKKASKKKKEQGETQNGDNNSNTPSGRNSDEEEDDTGIWGAKDEDDGAMDSEFEFQLEGAEADQRMDDFEGWGFEGAKKGLENRNGGKDERGDKRAVDIDEIIARRRAGKIHELGNDKADRSEEEEDKEEEQDNDEEAEEIALEFQSDVQDEFMAEDGFGMGVGSDVEESEGEEMDKESDDDERERENEQKYGSDEESVASEVPHPDDLEKASSDDESKDEDKEEEARRRAFFAPEEETVKGAKTNGTITFQNMSLSRPILRGLATVGFSQPTPIQAKTIPVALLGKDVVGGAVTGSGKTAAFVVPILERLLYRPKKVPTSRVVILMPTRELAIQCHAVATKLASYTDIKFCLTVGGLSLKMQEAELRLRPDVIIATPGRFIDHMRNSASFTVDTLEILVLDEADRMLEDGFADELNEILTTIPKSRQTMLFSATMTSSVDKLIRVGLNRPVRLMVDAQKQTVGTLVQEFVRLRPGREGKRMGYLLYLCSKVYTDKVIIFFRQKKEAHRARIIFGLTGLKAAELHGSMSQEQVGDCHIPNNWTTADL
jgi:ATP-dependent RNA helicase DDX27